MRIVYVLTSLGVGGAVRQALAVADRMAHRGHEVAILVLSPRLVDEWPTNLPTVYLNMRKTPVSFQAGLVEGRRFLRGFPPTCFTATAFTPTSLLACSNSQYPPPKLSPLFTTFTKAAGCVCWPTASLIYWQAAPPPSIKPLLIVSFALKLFLERSVSSFPTELTWPNSHPAKSAVRTLGRRWPQATASSGLPPAGSSLPRTFPTFCAP